MTATRYYLHGDRHEVDKALAYCKRCDAFEPLKHFDPSVCGREPSNVVRALYAAKEVCSREGRALFLRPLDAPNWFIHYVNKRFRAKPVQPFPEVVAEPMLRARGRRY